MNFESLLIRARLDNPQLKANVCPDSELQKVINQGAQEVARLTGCLKNNVKFDADTGINRYDITTIDTLKDEYLEIDKTPMLFREDSDSDYLPLIPKSRKWLDEYHPSWLNNDSGTPVYYFDEAPYIYTDRGPTSDVTDGFWIFYIKKPTPMKQMSNFPFGSSSELPQFERLSDSILLYVNWKTLPFLGKRDDFKLAENAFYKDAASKETFFNRRLDIKYDRRARFTGPKIRG